MQGGDGHGHKLKIPHDGYGESFEDIFCYGCCSILSCIKSNFPIFYTMGNEFTKCHRLNVTIIKPRRWAEIK